MTLDTDDGTLVRLTFDRIDPQQLVHFVSDASAGAISTFIGTTRDHFEGKQVAHLSYESYEPLAVKSLHAIVDRARRMWSLRRVAVVHRLGQVDVGEASVVIAVSSVHRKDAMQAVEYLIDTLKEETAIWKKEVYADGTCSWKENCCHSKTGSH